MKEEEETCREHSSSSSTSLELANELQSIEE